MLGGLGYGKEFLSQLLREKMIRKSVTCPVLLGKSIQQGAKQGELELGSRLLRRQFGKLCDRLVQKIKALLLKRLAIWGKALLDFQRLWLSPKAPKIVQLQMGVIRS